MQRQENKKNNVWFLDSGCSNHMSGDESWFTTLDKVVHTYVKLGNNTRMNVAGRGDIKIKLNGINHIITDVYYIPDLRNNLLDIGQFQERNLAIMVKEGACKIYHPSKGLFIETVMTMNRMFIINAET